MGDEKSREWRTAGLLHDTSLTLWTALAVRHAVGGTRAGTLDAAVVAANLAAGTPFALRRLRQRRRDPVALLGPPAVLAALLGTGHGGWSPVVATLVLHLLRHAERQREATGPGSRRRRHPVTRRAAGPGTPPVRSVVIG